MARKILCADCTKRTQQTAEKFSELFEAEKGTAKQDFKCDNCDVDIPAGAECFAAVLLPSKEHPNYKIQKPAAWFKTVMFKIKE